MGRRAAAGEGVLGGEDGITIRLWGWKGKKWKGKDGRAAKGRNGVVI